MAGVSDTACTPPHSATLRGAPDPFELLDELPTTPAAPPSRPASSATRTPSALHPAPEASPRAFVGPVRRGQQGFDAELIGRTGNHKVQVRLDAATALALRIGPILAVDRFRLHETGRRPGEGVRRRLSAAVIDALPWRGAGEDPGPRSAASGPAGESASAGSACPHPAKGARS